MRSRRRPTPPRPLDEDPFHRTALGYARNLIAGTTLRQLKPKVISEMESNDLVQELARYGGGAGDLEGKALRGKLQRLLDSKAGRPRQPKDPLEPARANLKVVGSLLGLGKWDRAVLQFLLTLNQGEGLQDLTCMFGRQALSRAARVVAAAIKAPLPPVLEVLSAAGPLVKAGMVRLSHHEHWSLGDIIELHPRLLDLVLRPGLDRRRFVQRFLPETGTGDLTLEDFAHVGAAAGLARDLLSAELAGRRGGTNILVHGPTGTGKTELARVLAVELGARLYSVGTADREGHTPTPDQRIASLLLGQRLMAREQALLLFDELEDLFDWRLSGLMGGGARGVAHMSKQWFNRALESNPVPTIWVTNATEGIDPAFLRRFSFAVELDQPGATQRARVLRRHLGDVQGLDEAQVSDLARRHPVSPAQLAGAVRSAASLGAQGEVDLALVERIIEPVERLVLGQEPPAVDTLSTGAYDLRVVNADADLEALASQLEGWEPRGGQGISICMYGPPGTGKSEFAAHLARRSGRELHRHMASDLLSKYVGETEQFIARAFRRAGREGAVLLLDEADSFLRDRRGAHHSWEVTQVNELLQQLERYPGIVVCTTNLMGDLDQAAMRRFVFKVQLGYLRRGQARIMARNTLEALGITGEALQGPEVERMAARPGLTPGDFAAVARRLRALGGAVEAADLLDGLDTELELKESPAARIGFGR